MKQAMLFINEIKKFQETRKKSDSVFFQADCEKHIKKLKRNLKDYCNFNNLDYDKLCKENNI